jgi:conserved oligomeric Golgi complex subunit 2
MSNKRSPTEPSYFVAGILRPLKSFFAIGTGDGPGAALRDDFLKGYANEVFDAVCQR